MLLSWASFRSAFIFMDTIKVLYVQQCWVLWYDVSVPVSQPFEPGSDIKGCYFKTFKKGNSLYLDFFPRSFTSPLFLGKRRPAGAFCVSFEKQTHTLNMKRQSRGKRIWLLLAFMNQTFCRTLKCGESFVGWSRNSVTSQPSRRRSRGTEGSRLSDVWAPVPQF